MAGDWVKIRTDLYRDPKVSLMADSLMSAAGRLASHISQNNQRDMSVTRNVTRNAVVGALVAVWGVARHQGKRYGDDICIENVTLSVIDDIADLPGMGEAMALVRWAVETEKGLCFPMFFAEHNADPADAKREKNRLRQERYRERDKSVTRNAKITHRVEREREKSKSNKEKQTKEVGEGMRNYSEQFIQFWSIFPPTRKGSKPLAWKAWQSAIERETPETILKAAGEFAASSLAKSEFCPGPAPWLNQDRWEDDREAWAKKGGPATNGQRKQARLPTPEEEARIIPGRGLPDD